MNIPKSSISRHRLEYSGDAMNIIPRLMVQMFLAFSGVLIIALALGLILIFGYERGRLLMVLAGSLVFILSARLEL